MFNKETLISAVILLFVIKNIKGGLIRQMWFFSFCKIFNNRSLGVTKFNLSKIKNTDF